MMCFQDRPTGTRDIQKAQSAIQKALNGDFIRGVQDRPAGAALSRYLKS